jgi:hypothetical protein
MIIKRTELTFTLGSKKLIEADYLYRAPKNIGIGYSVSHNRYESFDLSCSIPDIKFTLKKGNSFYFFEL